MDKKTLVLIKGYIEKAEEKLKTAEKLFQSNCYEDTASRAYYTAFHAAQAILLTEGLSADTHHGLVNLFGLHFVKTGKFSKKLGRYLISLKDERENGDYEVFSSIDREIAEQCLKQAKEFLTEAKNYLKKLFHIKKQTN